MKLWILIFRRRTNVAYGDKVLELITFFQPKEAAKYTGGLFVGKFIKTVTYQKILTKEANKEVGAAAARISHLEGMEAEHARTGDARLRKYGFQN